MELFLIAISILASTLALMALSAVLPVSSRGFNAFLCTIIGPAGIITGCLLGVASLFAAPWDSQLILHIPWELPLGTGTIGMDPLTRVFLLPVFGLGAVCVLSGAIALGHCAASEHNLGAHWFFFAVLILAQALVCVARDSVLLLIAWEAMSVSPFFLIEFNDDDPQVREASWIYLVAAHLGAVCLLACFALVWRETGSTVFTDFSLAPVGTAATAIFILSFLGFGAKAGIAPMHVWLPEAHPAAPSHVSAFLSGAMINAGIYGIIRVLYFFTPLNAAPAWWAWLCILMGLGSAVAGVLKAMAQGSLKRLLAYSSVENMGILLMGIGIVLMGVHTHNVWVSFFGFCGTMLHMLNHAAFKSLLFLGAGEVLHSTGTVRMNFLGGLQKPLPLVGIAFAIGTASIACLPPFNGFFGEFLLVLALGNGLHSGTTETTLGLLLILSGFALVGGLAVATFIKTYGTIFLGEPRTNAAQFPHVASPSALTPLLFPVLACVCTGFAGWYIVPYLATALPHFAPTFTAELPRMNATASELLKNAALFGAVLVGLTAVFVLWRRWLLRGEKKPTRTITWSCGFQKANARIQYTGASFSEPTSRIFGSAMGVKVHAHLDKSLFPIKATLALSRPDRVRIDVLTPFFDFVIRVCDALKIIQHGRIHLYILYMLLTVIVLLAWGLSS